MAKAFRKLRAVFRITGLVTVLSLALVSCGNEPAVTPTVATATLAQASVTKTVSGSATTAPAPSLATATLTPASALPTVMIVAATATTQVIPTTSLPAYPSASPSPKPGATTAVTGKPYAEIFGSMAISSDGKLAAVGQIDGKNNPVVNLWNLESGTLVATRASQSAITALAFSPDGTSLAIASKNQNVQLWNVARQEPVITLKTVGLGEIKNLFFSPNGKYLAIDSDKLAVWEVKTQTELSQFKDKGYTPLAFSLDSRLLLGNGQTTNLVIWQVETGKVIGQTPGYASIGVFSNDSKTVLAYNGVADNWGSGIISRWDIETGKVNQLVGHSKEKPASFTVGDFSPRAKYWAILHSGYRIGLFNAATNQRVAQYQAQSNSTNDDKGYFLQLKFSADGKVLAALADNANLSIWNINSGKLQLTLRVSQ